MEFPEQVLIYVALGLFGFDLFLHLMMVPTIYKTLGMRTAVPKYVAPIPPEMTLDRCRGRRHGIVWYGQGRTLYFRTQLLFHKGSGEMRYDGDEMFDLSVPSFGRIEVDRDGKMRAWWFPAFPITTGLLVPTVTLVLATEVSPDPLVLVGWAMLMGMSIALVGWLGHNVFDTHVLPAAIAAINAHREEI